MATAILTMKRTLFLSAFIFLLFGCTQGLNSPSGQSIDLSKISQELNDPFVQLSLQELSASQISGLKSSLSADCASSLETKPYTAIYAAGPKGKITFFVDGSTKNIVCVHKELENEARCKSNADCDDGLLSTNELCEINGNCKNERTIECKNGDNFCPQGCIKKTDSDCIKECNENDDCEDGDNLTVNSCSGLIGKCGSKELFLQGKKAVSCTLDSECVPENFCAIGLCRENFCNYENKPNGTSCGKLKECAKGECVEATKQTLTIMNYKIEPGEKDYSVQVSWETNKITFGQVKYGLVLYAMKAIPLSGLSSTHFVVLEGLQPGIKYLYQIFSSDSSKIFSTQTQALEFTVCSPCDDSNECTKDYCSLQSGKCIFEPIALGQCPVLVQE